MSLKLPSTVTDVKHLCMPLDRRVVDDEEEWEKCGKWSLLIPNNDLSWADKVWTDLQPLLSNGCLLLLKIPMSAFKESGVILCYTRPGQEEARKAAESIREVVHYEGMMYHKSNKATKEGRGPLTYRKNISIGQWRGQGFGERRCSQYMHTYLGRFYVRDAIGRWKFVDARNESRNSGRDHEAPSEAANIPLELEPFPTSGVVLDLNRCSETHVVAGRNFSKGRFVIKYNLQRGEVEADCIWSAVKSLYDDGDFIRIRSSLETEIAASIYCHVRDDSDLQILINIAKRIFRTTRFPSIIYFDIETRVKKYILKYVFTPQGEVYGQLSTGLRKFILSFEKES